MVTALMDRITVDVAAEALFVSQLQQSDHADPGHIPAIVFMVVSTRGESSCAAEVAQEFGDHPQNAADRMCWCRAVVAEWFLRTS